jgi:hypothetical protein
VRELIRWARIGESKPDRMSQICRNDGVEHSTILSPDEIKRIAKSDLIDYRLALLDATSVR